jgi:cytochrome c peroxidase
MNRRAALPLALWFAALPIAFAAPFITPAPQANPNGSALTASSTGSIDLGNPFFKAMGNGRSCATCHTQAEGWTVTPAGLQARFNASNGNDPAFRLNDGANSPLAPATTLEQKRLAYSMLLSKGVIRVGLPIPANAEFTLVRSEDPYNFASAKELSLFRRPLPSANLKFAAMLMWDGRETFSEASVTQCILNARPAQCFASLDFNLLHQAESAVRGHAESAAGLSAAEQRAIVNFERSLIHAQSVSGAAGNLAEAGARGGPALLAAQDFYWGINDVQEGDYRTLAPFTRNASTMFGAWRNLDVPPPPPQRGRPAPAPTPPTAQNLARSSVARGEAIFNNRPMNIAGVAGFSDTLRVPLQRGTCTSCHNAPNALSHSIARMFNTGVSAGQLRTPDMPLYTLRNTATGETVQTSDPGAAMLSGAWRDVGKFKTPNLRGLAARAPYFHDGSARNAEEVVRFYDRRFRMGLNPQEQADLAAYLKVL